MADNFERGAAMFLSGLLRGHQSRLENQIRERQQAESERQAQFSENMLRQRFELEQEAERRRAEEEARLGARQRELDIGQEVERQKAVLAEEPLRKAARLEERLTRQFAPPRPAETHLPEGERLALEHQYRMQEIGARGAGERAAKELQTEQDYMVEQVRNWKAIGSVGPYPTKDMDPTLLGRSAKYKYAKAAEGTPITDEEAIATNLALDNLDALQTAIASAPPEDPLRIVYDEIALETGGDFAKPLWKGRTANALLGGRIFDDEETVDLEDIAREMALQGGDLAQALTALFGPQAKRRGDTRAQMSRAAATETQRVAAGPMNPVLPVGP